MMIEHRKADNLKVENRKPRGGEIKVVQCKNCGEMVRSNRPGEAYECRCGWKMSRS